MTDMRTKPWDPAEHLETEEAMVGCLSACDLTGMAPT